MSASTHAAGTDDVVRLPVVGGVTFNEAHSALLGMVGLFAGVGYQTGYRETVVGFTIVAVLVAFGMRRASGDTMPVAQRVIRREPWYFLTTYLATTLLAAAAWPML